MKEVELGGSMVTLGTDLNTKFAWCLRKVNGIDCICLHVRTPSGGSCFCEKDFIAALPLERVEYCAKLLIRESEMKKSITFEDIFNNSQLTQDCRTFYANIHSLKEFGNYCNCNVFVYLFGNDEGHRLWKCFVEDTHRDIYKLFFEYLNNEQKFILTANILENKDLRMSTL